jgi:2-oxoglutarate ferredoxin oxidoreductase subunit beta
MATSLLSYRDLLREERLPHIWCSGCGHGIVLQAVLKAIAASGVDRDKVSIVSGIGCSSRAALYADFDTLHTTHGRAIPFATGLRLAKPEMTVVVLTGDGDCAAIGGNHLIHAARRNIDLTVVVFNNTVYGMTSGQYSPTTAPGARATTAPEGAFEPAFDLCKLAEAAGATYVARGTTYHAPQLASLIQRAIGNHGFSLVDCITGCPTCFGRRNRDMFGGKGDGVSMIEWQRDHAVNVRAAASMSPEQLGGKIVIGEFVNRPGVELTDRYAEFVRGHAEEGGGPL